MSSTVQSSQALPIVLNLFAAILGAIGQYLYKIGGIQLKTVPLIKNWPLYTGMALFCVVMVLFVWAFNIGGKLSVVYHVYATTFIWAMIIAVWIGKEPYSLIQLLGVLIIILGVSLIAIGYPK